VEAVCDRVGILREGRLVDEGTLTELRHLSAQTVEVTFRDSPPDLGRLDGVQAISAGEKAVRYEVTGEVGPLIAALAKHPVLSLTSREPSLEEIFLHHYGSSAGDAGG
jgi:polyether ionophore transport system ATP-binding protein